MKTEIPYIEHRVYRHTFLERVILRFNFDSDIEDKFGVLKCFFLENFQLDFDEEKFNLMKINHLDMSGNNGELSFKFAKDFIQIKIERSFYRSFNESMLPYFLLAEKLIRLMNGKVNRLSLKKINLWPFETLEGEDIYSRLRYVFNEQLVSRLPEERPEKSFILKTTMVSDESKRSLVLAFGCQLPSEGKKYSCIVLDTESVCDDTDALEWKNLESTVEAENQDLFDVYHWAVTQGVLDIMDKELEQA